MAPLNLNGEGILMTHSGYWYGPSTNNTDCIKGLALFISQLPKEPLADQSNSPNIGFIYKSDGCAW